MAVRKSPDGVGSFCFQAGPKCAWGSPSSSGGRGGGGGSGGMLPRENFGKMEPNPAILCVLAVKTEWLQHARFAHKKCTEIIKKISFGWADLVAAREGSSRTPEPPLGTGLIHVTCLVPLKFESLEEAHNGAEQIWKRKKLVSKHPGKDREVIVEKRFTLFGALSPLFGGTQHPPPYHSKVPGLHQSLEFVFVFLFIPSLSKNKAAGKPIYSTQVSTHFWTNRPTNIFHEYRKIVHKKPQLKRSSTFTKLMLHMSKKPRILLESTGVAVALMADQYRRCHWMLKSSHYGIAAKGKERPQRQALEGRVYRWVYQENRHCHVGFVV